MESGDVLTLVLMTLAIYRVSFMLTQEEGPGGIIAAMRGKIDPSQSSWLGRGARCIACVSFWLAGLAALLIHGSILDWLGMAGGVLVIHRIARQA